MLALAWPAAGAALAAELPPPLDDSNYRPAPRFAQVELGRSLFFDKILSGNRNIACATCHHPDHASADGLSLPLGEGGRGRGPARTPGFGPDAVYARVPRNAPALFNLGACEFDSLFHDGRLAAYGPRGRRFISPEGERLPEGLESIVAAQALFPMTAPLEMAGQAGENPVADAVAVGRRDRAWGLLAARLRAIPDYVFLFQAAFPEVEAPEDIRIAHAANAIAAFVETAFRSHDSPFDRYLEGDEEALGPAERRGMALFYGEAGCAGCHSGPLQTDHRFHALALPPLGPGKGDPPQGRGDLGRYRVTGDPGDRYAFRTPSLRNVALTGPWGHNGAYATLEGVVRHHLDPVRALLAYDPGQALLPSRFDLDPVDREALEDPQHLADIAAVAEPARAGLSDGQVADLVAFLHALTGDGARDLGDEVPSRVLSGLPVQD